jgi:hypothetical protein
MEYVRSVPEMMEQNKKTEIHLYCGFRKATETVLGMKICY